MRFLILFSLTAFAIFIIPNVYFIWAGGYWENYPILDHVSGPMRFTQFVANPIPKGIYNLRGGYSGFPQGQVVTYFEFRKPLNEHEFLKDWIKVKQVRETLVHDFFGDKMNFSKLYQHKEGKYYLVLDEVNNKGIFHMP